MKTRNELIELCKKKEYEIINEELIKHSKIVSKARKSCEYVSRILRAIREHNDWKK